MKRIRFLLLLMTMIETATAQSRLSPEQLMQQVKDTLALQKGFFAVAFRDLSTGETLLWNEHESFHAASTMKTPVMIEVFKQAEAGRFSLNDSIPVKNAFKSIVDGSPYKLDSTDDSQQALYHQTGTKMLLKELVRQMIIRSSNLATNILMEMVSGAEVTKTMRSMGAKDIQVLRGVEDQKAFDKGLNNTTTAYDLMLIYEQLSLGKAVSVAASKSMIDVLLDQQDSSVIPAGLPPGIKVAHKTGSITGVHHDSGIVYMPDGKQYVLVLLSKQLADNAAATKAMSVVSGLFYHYMQQAK